MVKLRVQGCLDYITSVGILSEFPFPFFFFSSTLNIKEMPPVQGQSLMDHERTAFRYEPPSGMLVTHSLISLSADQFLVTLKDKESSGSEAYIACEDIFSLSSGTGNNPIPGNT